MVDFPTMPISCKKIVFADPRLLIKRISRSMVMVEKSIIPFDFLLIMCKFTMSQLSSTLSVNFKEIKFEIIFFSSKRNFFLSSYLQFFLFNIPREFTNFFLVKFSEKNSKFERKAGFGILNSEIRIIVGINR